MQTINRYNHLCPGEGNPSDTQLSFRIKRSYRFEDLTARKQIVRLRMCHEV